MPSKGELLDPDVFESLCRLDELIEDEDQDEERREELIFQRDVLSADYPATARFRYKTVFELMEGK
jgi:hypothetical protein